MNSKPLVIIVEDDRDLSDAIADVFELTQDVDVELITDGMKAVERFEVVIPRLILLDIHLPKVSGIELLNRFLETWRSSGTKIIAMTADLVLISQIENRVDSCLPKPFSVEQLSDAVSGLLASPPD